MYLTRYAVVVLSAPVLVATLACAARQPGATEARSASARQARTSSTRNVLSIDELRQAKGSNAFEIIQQLRPVFLRSRGPLHAPTIFVDHIRRGGVDELHGIPASSIAEIRHLDSRAATQLFGTGYSGGVIHILTRTQ